MYHDADGNILAGDPRDHLDYVRKALCAWRKKVIQFQVPLFSENTKGVWILRFDDVIANALELGSLKNAEQELPREFVDRVSAVTPKGVPSLDLPRT